MGSDQRDREAFFDRLNEQYAALQADAAAWAEELAERALWEYTLMDDLEDDPWLYEEDAPLLTATKPGCETQR